MRRIFQTGFLVVAVASVLGACGGVPRDVIGIDGAELSARDVPGVTRHRVFVATTRAPTNEIPARFYTRERGKALRFAHVDVYVPPTHETGRVERPKRLPPDPRKEMVAIDPNRLDGDSSFVAALNEELRSRPNKDRNILVFIHGYNTSFDGALFRITQFIHDTGYTGVPVLFTWPSGGRLTDYVYDINSALSARDDLIRTFGLLVGTESNGGDIVAHSMGNLLLVEAMRQTVLSRRFRAESAGVRNVIMASPDIDIDLFESQVRALQADPEIFKRRSQRVYILLSEDDKALAISRRLAGKVDRVGNSDELERLAAIGVNVLDLTEVDSKGNVNHSKFADAPEIVKLIGGRLKEEGDALSAEEGTTLTGRVIDGVYQSVTAIPRSVISTNGPVHVAP